MSRFEKPKRTGDVESDLNALYTYLNKIADEYNRAINNIDASNINPAFLEEITKPITNNRTPVARKEKAQQSLPQSTLLYENKQGAIVGSTITLQGNAEAYRMFAFELTNGNGYYIQYALGFYGNAKTINDKGVVRASFSAVNTSGTIITYYIVCYVSGTEMTINTINNVGSEQYKISQIWGLK